MDTVDAAAEFRAKARCATLRTSGAVDEAAPEADGARSEAGRGLFVLWSEHEFGGQTEIVVAALELHTPDNHTPTKADNGGLVEAPVTAAECGASKLAAVEVGLRGSPLVTNERFRVHIQLVHGQEPLLIRRTGRKRRTADGGYWRDRKLVRVRSVSMTRSVLRL